MHSPSFRGGNPLNVKEEVGKPDSTNAVSTALQPGMTSISWFLLSVSDISLYPGSLMQGIPLSEHKPTIVPFSSSFMTWGMIFSSRGSMYVNTFCGNGILKWLYNFLVMRVSSQSRSWISLRILTALYVMSSMLPMGVAIMYSLPTTCGSP